MECKCTILFYDPFWVGIFERQDEMGYSAARIVFGAEPSDASVYQFILKDYYRLRFSAPQSGAPADNRSMKFKRRQREVRRQMLVHQQVGTRAQNALQAEREAQAKQQKMQRSQAKNDRKDDCYEMRRERKKQKRRGR
jgi:hypothetical protein